MGKNAQMRLILDAQKKIIFPLRGPYLRQKEHRLSPNFLGVKKNDSVINRLLTNG